RRGDRVGCRPPMEPLHTLVVAARRYASVRRAPRAPAGDDPALLEPPAFLAAWSALLERLPAGVVRRAALVRVPVNRPPWHDAGLELAPGDCVTIFGAGRVFLSRRLDVWVGPQFQLWARVGGTGPIFNGP